MRVLFLCHAPLLLKTSRILENAPVIYKLRGLENVRILKIN